ncbi:MAG: 50S ribosomal protein L17 [Thermoplasmata archaeon]|nr:MAG: 50S ribosomal protein L17 [Thermoplasmata archaeon]
MRHKKKSRRFTKSKNQEKAMFKALATSLILNEKIITTEAKAKELRSFIEKTITRAKKDTLANRRLLAKIFSKKIIKKLFEEIGPRYKDRPGGYTRIIKLNPRPSDGAKMAIIEFV